MKLFNCLLTVILALIIKPSAGQLNPATFKIYDTKQKKEVSLDKIVRHASKVNAILFGEYHNDSIAHLLQEVLHRTLIQRYGYIALSLEGLSTDQQSLLNSYLEGATTAQEFEEKASVWMPYYHSYKRLIEVSIVHGLPVVAANAPRRAIALVADSGMAALYDLDETSRSFLPPIPYFVPKGKYYNQYMEGMRKVISPTDSMYQSFCLYDATMALSIFRFLQEHKAYKVLHVTGRTHIDDYLGTVAQLRRLGPTKFLTISCSYSANFTHPDWSKYLSLADYIILTDPTIKKSF